MRKNSKIVLIAAAIDGALGVVLGAFGAHGLAELLESTGRASTWETATFYQLAHAPAILLLALCIPYLDRPKLGSYAAVCWLAGTIIFSGSLYLLSVGGPNWLGAITPIGGLLFITGWLFVAGIGGIALSSQNSRLN